MSLLVGGAFWLSGCGSIPFLGGGSATDPRAGADPAEWAQRSADEPDEPLWPFRLAEHAMAGADAVTAERELRTALSRDAEHAPSLSLLSKLFWDQSRHEEAVALLEGARAATAEHRELRLALALHYEAMEEFDRAAALMESANPTESMRTWLQLRGDDFTVAEATARRALDADPDSAVNRNNWGITRLYAGEPEAARKAFLTAIDADPKLPGPFYNLAIVDRFYRFDEDSARDWFRRYLEFSTEDPDGLAEILAVEVAAGTNEPEEAQP